MKRVLILYNIIMCMLLSVAAQDTIHIPDVPGIRLGANRLDFPGSRERFDSLLCRLKNSDEHLNILHIGGSIFFGTTEEYLRSPLAGRFLAPEGGEEA